MQVVTQSSRLRAIVKDWRQQNQSVALVPTMGNLHAGHLSLVNMAHSKTQKVIVSIFVNPLQFNQSSDLQNYPRTPDKDLQKLSDANVDLVFMPDEKEMYPSGRALAPRITIPALSEEFCGRHRPGHFEGVCTAVAKLFNICTPDIAVFGEKDYQQLLIIQRLTQELNFNIEIFSGQTSREADGLALSSRNSLLSAEHRKIAPCLHKVLQETQQNYMFSQIATLVAQAKKQLIAHGFQPEYFSIRNAEDLSEVTQPTENIVILAAAWLGETRLIDNLRFSTR